MSVQILQARGIKKYYTRGSETVKALDGVDFEINSGEFVAIVGPSGSGKTTLMNMISCLDSPSEGSLIVGKEDVSRLNEDQLIHVRRGTLGFIFQQFYLIPTLTVEENIALPLVFAKQKVEKLKLEKAMRRVGLENKKDAPVKNLSGGDKQRVAIARALVQDPKLIIADEPTGKLEGEMGETIISIFEELANEGMAIFMATHNLDLAARAQRIIHLQDGVIVPKSESLLY